MKYDFTSIMDRRGMDAIAVDGLQGYFLAKPANIPTRIAPAARQIIENSHSSDCG